MKMIKKLLKFGAVLLIVSGLAGCKIVGSDDGTQNGGGNDAVYELTAANSSKTGSSTLTFTVSGKLNAANGEKIKVSFTLSGASNYKQLGIISSTLGTTWDNYGSTGAQIWAGDSGLTDPVNFNGEFKISKDITSFSMDVYVLNAIDSKVSSNVTISNIKITNKTKTTPPATPVSFAFTNDDNYAVDKTNLPSYYSTLKMGWNYGNSLDAYANGVANETCWGNPAGTQALFDGVAAQGFDTVRIPVTWMGHIGNAESKYKIDESYMNRVKEVVGYAKNAGLKVILNIHHDGADSNFWLNIMNACGIIRTATSTGLTYTNSNPSSASAQAARKQIGEQLFYMWGQIASAFPNSEDYIIFETLNEIHDGGWGWGENKKNSDTEQYNVLNEWNQICVRAIRYAGAKNYIGIQGYVCNPTLTIQYLEIPTDKLERLLISVHDYDPAGFTLEATDHDWGTETDKNEIKNTLDALKAKSAEWGYPVYIGETGAVYQGVAYNADRIAYNTNMIKEANAHGILPVFWDNGAVGEGAEKSGLFNRTTGAVNDFCTELVSAMKVAAGK